jgi:Uma2 family endonuclease
MSVATPPLPNISAQPMRLRPFSVDEYHRMIQAGVLTEHDSVELLEGWIVLKMPRDPQHETAVDAADEALKRRLQDGWRVRVQSAITTGDSEPEPDIVVARGPISRYQSRHPGPEDILLVVEVSNTTLAFDRSEKARVYARAGIPNYWIVNVRDWRIEAYSEPSGPAPAPGYRRHSDYQPGDAVPLVLGEEDFGAFAVSEFLRKT